MCGNNAGVDWQVFFVHKSEKALIYESELDFISRCVLDYPEIETGGDLFGFWTHSGRPVVHYAIGPGPRSRRTVSFFNQDVEYLQSCGDRLRDLHGLQHIGEWHSHHRLGLNRPSSHDTNTVTNAIRDYQLRCFLLVICTIADSHTDIRGFLYSKSTPSAYQDIGWVVLPGENTLRTSIDKEISDLVHFPKTVKAALGAIDRASLYEPPSVFTPLPKDSWIGTEYGRDLLKAIHDELASGAGSVRMTLLETKQISFTWVYDAKHRSLLFPANSPSPVIYFESCGHEGRTLEWDTKEMSNTGCNILQLAKSLIAEVKCQQNSIWTQHV